MTAESPDEVFSALGDATRREVMSFLARDPAATATEIANHLPVTRQAVVKHLAALADAGLVEARKEGREVHYRLTPAPLAEAVSWMADLGAEWDARLSALRAHLERNQNR